MPALEDIIDEALQLETSFKQSDEATARSVWSKLRETAVSVVDFGALGNGDPDEDDTAAFQAAIDYVRTATQSQSGSLLAGVVLVPPGSYYVSNIQLRTGVCLMGTNTHSAILVHLPAHTGSMITLNTADVNFAEVRNLTVSGGGREGIGIDFQNSDDDAVINAATIFDIGDPNNRIADVLVTNFNGGSASTGIKINSRAVQVTNVRITHCDFGLDIDSSDGKFHELDINWIGKRALTIGGGNNELSKVKVWYCGIDSSYAFGDGFYISSGRNMLTGCQAQDVSRCGLVIDSGDNNVIEGLLLDNIGNFFLHQSQGIEHPTSTQKVAVSLEGASPTYNKVSFTLAQRSASPDLQGVLSMVSGSLNNHIEAMANAAHLSSGAPPIHFTGQPAGTNVVEINGIRQGIVAVDIAASEDDGAEVIAGGANSITSTSTTINNTRINGWRFLTPTLPQGANIIDARLHFTPSASHSDALDILVDGEDADTSAVFGTVASDISGRARTTAQVTWTVGAWTSSTRDYHTLSPNLATVVQEIVDRAGFGGVVTLFTRGQGANVRSPATQDNASLAAPTLYVQYEL